MKKRANPKLGRPLAGLVVVLVLASLMLLAARPATPQAPTRTPHPEFPTLPPEYGTDWPVAQGNVSGTRSAVSTILSQNVAQLNAVWTFDLPVPGIYGSVTANPIVSGDTVFIQDMASNVFALNRGTGKLRWKAEYSIGSAGPNGVSAGYGMVFAPLGDTGEVVALDQATGKTVWRQQIGHPPGEGIDMAPIAYGGLVYVSTVPGTSGGDFYEAGDRGVLYALEASSGEVEWWFDTTAGGWGSPKIAGGGGLWYPPSFDEAGNIYFGVGNASPAPLNPNCPNGSCRPGDNLYTDSMVSLDPNGKVRWYYQDRKHDLLDLDFQNTPVLTGGLAIGSGKSGNVVAVNRDTGKVQWKRPVCIHKNDELTELPKDPIEIYPGSFGGIVSPIAASGGALYVTCLNVPQYQSATGPGPNNSAFASGTSSLYAIDSADGSVNWERKIRTILLSGATVTNDVVFAAGLDGFLRGFDTATGTELWSYESRSGYNAPPAVTGDTLFAAGGFLKFAQGGSAPIGADPGGTNAPIPQLVAFR